MADNPVFCIDIGGGLETDPIINVCDSGDSSLPINFRMRGVRNWNWCKDCLNHPNMPLYELAATDL